MCSPNTNDKDYLSIIKALLIKDEAKLLGIESSQTNVSEYNKLKNIGISLKLLDEEISMIRIIKDDEEIAIMKEAIAITDDIFAEVIKKICVVMSENDISALLQYYAIKAGATQMSFDTVVCSGERSALPHGRPTHRQVQAHEPIMIDFGIQYKGYQSDMTRVVFIGKPETKILEIYNIVLKAQLAGIKAIREGAIACDVDKATRDVIKKHGYGDYFVHGLGHGLGIGDGSEYPLINEKSQMILENNMMMSCEPGIYIPNIGGIRIEDDIIIINGQGVPLNKSSKELIILDEK